MSDRSQGTGALYASLTDVLKVTLKKSDNLAAEALFYHVGKHGTDKGGSLGNLDGQVAIRKYMKELVGMDPDRYSIADGSGVSLYNYISPHLLLSYLNYAYRHPVISNLSMTVCR